MNPRILELQHQAMSSILNGNDPDGDVERMYIPAEFTKKFAELIIRECTTVLERRLQGDMSEDMDVVYCILDIEKHFGVKP